MSSPFIAKMSVQPGPQTDFLRSPAAIMLALALTAVPVRTEPPPGLYSCRCRATSANSSLEIPKIPSRAPHLA